MMGAVSFLLKVVWEGMRMCGYRFGLDWGVKMDGFILRGGEGGEGGCI